MRRVPGRSALYHILWLGFGAVLRLLFRWRVEGGENLPDDGPVLLCINHRSYWDPPVVGCAVHRRIHFMAKEELFRLPVLKWVLPRVGAFPVRRGPGDRRSLRRALELLQKGEVVAIFPEGGRSPNGRLQPGRAGAARLAMEPGVAVVPMAIDTDYKWFRPMRVRIGRPIDMAAYREKHWKGKELQEISSRVIMGAIAGLLPPERGGRPVETG